MDRVDKVDGPPKLPEGLKSIGMGLGTNGTILNDVSSVYCLFFIFDTIFITIHY